MSNNTPNSAKKICGIAAGTIFSVLASSSFATEAGAEASALSKLVQNSKTQINFRYRYEGVDQDSLAEDANANTLRSRLSWTSGTINSFSAKLEFDDVRSIGNDNYNSTANGNGSYPVVADPEGTELNQAFIKYKNGGLSATLGRQRINLDDQRFVGGVGWRQNEQTYDALRFNYKTSVYSLDYSYVDNVNRIFGPDGSKANLKGDSHLLNARLNLAEGHSLSAFNYLLDFNTAATASSNTMGVRYVGQYKPLKVIASYARQSDAGDNPVHYDADYWLLDLSGKIKSFSWRLGQETLGSDDGAKAFNTPLATLHKFQGFSDKFLGTPANGVEDRYIGFGTKISGLALKLSYHDFASAEGSDDLGTEWNASAAYKLNKNFKALLKYADYSADQYASDTQKLWLQLVYSL